MTLTTMLIILVILLTICLIVSLISKRPIIQHHRKFHLNQKVYVIVKNKLNERKVDKIIIYKTNEVDYVLRDSVYENDTIYRREEEIILDPKDACKLLKIE